MIPETVRECKRPKVEYGRALVALCDTIGLGISHFHEKNEQLSLRVTRYRYASICSEPFLIRHVLREVQGTLR